MSSPTTGGLQAWLAKDPIIRFVSSVWFGISVLTAILIYASLASAIAPLRAVVEMTEMRIFRHWIFVGLIITFMVSLSLATWFRIRWNRLSIGVLTVHSGLLILCIGSIIYFGRKVEGVVRLETPRIELALSDGRAVPNARIAARVAESWSGNMPALGGAVAFSVKSIEAGASGPVSSAVIDVQSGEQPPREIKLVAGSRPFDVLSDRLVVRLTAPAAQRRFYDTELAGLYFWQGERSGSRQMIALPNLPMFRERYVDRGYVLEDSEGVAVPSKRTSPAISFAGASIPTGWIEPWRLDTVISPPGAPFELLIDGFVPYIDGAVPYAVAGDAQDPAGLTVNLSTGSGGQTVSLFADPARSLTQLGIPIEFRWVTSEAECDRLMTPLAGGQELTIEVVDPPVVKTIAIAAGQKIRVEGTAYEIDVDELLDDWPMMSPGFEGAKSPVAKVNVRTTGKSYQRTVIQRFPQLSQDIDEQNVRHREGPYDSNLNLTYRTSARRWLLIAAGPGVDPMAAAFEPDGKVRTAALRPGAVSQVSFGTQMVKISLVGMFEHAAAEARPVLTPVALRRPKDPRDLSAIRLTLRERDKKGGWSKTQWVEFSTMPEFGERPVTFALPDGQKWTFMYSRFARDLNAELLGERLKVNFFPGRNEAESWESNFYARDIAGSANAEFKPAMVKTNETYNIGRWTLFQSGAAMDHWSFTTLGVGSRDGVLTMTLGCILVTLGSLYAFYVKPVLRRRMQIAALAAARKSGKLPPISVDSRAAAEVAVGAMQESRS